METKCTGVSATWCPIHGACTCKDPRDLNDDDCPLHSERSSHGMIECPACSRAGGADRPVYHTPPTCSES
jgi:hypothetical protein